MIELIFLVVVGIVIGLWLQRIHWMLFLSLAGVIASYHFYISKALTFLPPLPSWFLALFGGVYLAYFGFKIVVRLL